MKFQQWQIMIVDKPTKRSKSVVSTYVVAAFTREEAISAFCNEVGEQHLTLAQSWACSSTQSLVARSI